MSQLKGVSNRNIIIAIVISVSVSAYLIYSNFEAEAFKTINWTFSVLMFMVGAGLFMVIRHLGYMLRLKIITDHQLTWRQCFESISIWEFASCATPSTVGGAAVAMFILNREQLSMGKSTATIMAISFLDNTFFIVASLLGIIFVGRENMFLLAENCGNMVQLDLINNLGGLESIFWVGFSFSLAITAFLGMGVFGYAKAMKKILIGFTAIPFLKRFRESAISTGDEIITTSNIYRKKSYQFWIKLSLITMASWTFKFAVVNLLISAFGEVLGIEQIVVFSKVLALWVIMLIPITPGASGVAEITFMALFCKYVNPGIIATVSFCWRLFTYFPYLVLGTIITPRWMARTSKLKRRVSSK